MTELYFLQVTLYKSSFGYTVGCKAYGFASHKTVTKQVIPVEKLQVTEGNRVNPSRLTKFYNR